MVITQHVAKRPTSLPRPWAAFDPAKLVGYGFSCGLSDIFPVKGSIYLIIIDCDGSICYRSTRSSAVLGLIYQFHGGLQRGIQTMGSL